MTVLYTLGTARLFYGGCCPTGSASHWPASRTGIGKSEADAWQGGVAELGPNEPCWRLADCGHAACMLGATEPLQRCLGPHSGGHAQQFLEQCDMYWSSGCTFKARCASRDEHVLASWQGVSRWLVSSQRNSMPGPSMLVRAQWTSPFKCNVVVHHAGALCGNGHEQFVDFERPENFDS